MVKRSAKQIIKQSVNVKVHVGDSKKKSGRRRKKRGGGSGGGSGGSSMPQPIHAFTPVYIQSGTPSESDNPLHRAIRELNDKVDRQHIEHKVNPLLNMVANEGKGHIAEDKQTVKPVKRTPAKIKSEFGNEIPAPSSHHHSAPPNTDDWMDRLHNHRGEAAKFSYNNPMHKKIGYDSDSATPQFKSPPVTTRVRVPKRNDVWKQGDLVPPRPTGRGRKTNLRLSYESQNPGKSEY